MTCSPWSGDIYKSLQTRDTLAAFPKTSRLHRLCLCLRRDADGPSRLRYGSRVCRKECDVLYVKYSAVTCFGTCRPSRLVFVLTRRDSTFLTNPLPPPHPSRYLKEYCFFSRFPDFARLSLWQNYIYALTDILKREFIPHTEHALITNNKWLILFGELIAVFFNHA
jgi:hypothetical protein